MGEENSSVQPNQQHPVEHPAYHQQQSYYSYSNQQQPFYSGQQPPPPPHYGQPSYNPYAGSNNAPTQYYQQQQRPMYAPAESANQWNNVKQANRSPSPTLDTWIFWLSLIALIFIILSEGIIFLLLKSVLNIFRLDITLFMFSGFILSILFVTFARKPNRPASITLATLGILCATSETIVLHFIGSFSRQVTFNSHGFLLGILYSIKAHKLRNFQQK